MVVWKSSHLPSTVGAQLLQKLCLGQSSIISSTSHELMYSLTRPPTILTLVHWWHEEGMKT